MVLAHIISRAPAWYQAVRFEFLRRWAAGDAPSSARTGAEHAYEQYGKFFEGSEVRVPLLEP